MTTLVRAQLFHTPRSPFDVGAEALAYFSDGALVFDQGSILDVGDYRELGPRYPKAEVRAYPDAIVIPGMVDAHVHYPQLPVIGAMGLHLLDWLEQRTLPEEAKFSDVTYAKQQARTFLRQLARNGTTTALVFGAHFKGAMEVFFEEALASGLRITSGLVLGDQHLNEALHTTPEQAYEESRALAHDWHGRGRLRYAVTPRFSLSCSEKMLETCGRLLAELPDLWFTSHINEQPDEIAFVAELFPWASDYLATYERYGLVGQHSVFAHNVHPKESELARLAKTGAAVCHCASSNMFIGSGLFKLRQHIAHGVQLALGSDVGGGTGFSLFKEGLMAYQAQMLLGEEGYELSAAHLLYLATAAGASALGLADRVGDFSAGKQADFVVVQAPDHSTLREVLKQSPSAEASLAALFTLAREDCVQDVFIGGASVLT